MKFNIFKIPVGIAFIYVRERGTFEIKNKQKNKTSFY
jgi:hypothetical protein